MSHVRLWIGIGCVENRLQVTASHSMIVTLRIGCQTARLRLHFGEDTTRSDPFLLADTASLREVSVAQIVQSITNCLAIFQHDP